MKNSNSHIKTTWQSLSETTPAALHKALPYAAFHTGDNIFLYQGKDLKFQIPSIATHRFPITIHNNRIGIGTSILSMDNEDIYEINNFHAVMSDQGDYPSRPAPTARFELTHAAWSPTLDQVVLAATWRKRGAQPHTRVVLYTPKTETSVVLIEKTTEPLYQLAFSPTSIIVGTSNLNVFSAKEHLAKNIELLSTPIHIEHASDGSVILIQTYHQTWIFDKDWNVILKTDSTDKACLAADNNSIYSVNSDGLATRTPIGGADTKSSTLKLPKTGTVEKLIQVENHLYLKYIEDGPIYFIPIDT